MDGSVFFLDMALRQGRIARSFMASDRRAARNAATAASHRRTSRSQVATKTKVATGDGSAKG